jgi:HK97 family phage portal protein
MRSNLIDRLLGRTNKYNNAFFSFFGGGEAQYDYNKINYITKGYNINPFVYSVVNQRATKFASIPFEIKEIEDKDAMKKANRLVKTTNYNLTPKQRLELKKIESKAYGTIKDFKLVQPNPITTWLQFKELFETYLATCGEVFIYKLAPEGGMEAGEPIAYYILPSHYMEIVVKPGNKIGDLDSPIKCYKLIEGDQYTEFTDKEIIHIKYSNPNYDLQATNVYGHSPLRAVWKNVENSNEALDLNKKTLRSGGAFGLIHAKGQSGFTEPQAKALKEKLLQMDADSGRLGKMAGVSAEIGFTRLSLSADELKPFDYLTFDEKQICNALGWDAKLLNNDNGAKYDNYKVAQKRVLIDTIVPDLQIFENLFNEHILPLYKDYQGYCLKFDISDLPEMQDDMKSLVEWLSKANDKGFVTKNEAREIMNLDIVEDDLMNQITVIDDVLTLEQSLDDFPSVQ